MWDDCAPSGMFRSRFFLFPTRPLPGYALNYPSNPPTSPHCPRFEERNKERSPWKGYFDREEITASNPSALPSNSNANSFDNRSNEFRSNHHIRCLSNFIFLYICVCVRIFLLATFLRDRTINLAVRNSGQWIITSQMIKITRFA